jgi:MFS family permease
MVTYDYYDGRNEPGHIERVGDKYDLYYVNGALNNIAEKKYRWDDDAIAVSWRAAYYIALALALLVLIYRHTTRRTFFLSLLTSVVLTILTGLFLAMSASSESGFFTWLIIYFIVFALLASTIINSEQRNVISGIGLNLLVFITAFMPLVATAAYYNYLHNKYEFRDEPGIYDRIFKYEALHYFMAEIGGFILLLVLLATLYQKAYRKWYSLPEQ